MQRICFKQMISLLNHPLQLIQGVALIYQSLIFSLKNLFIAEWISLNIDFSLGLKLMMIDIDGNVTIDEHLFYDLISELPYNPKRCHDALTVLRWFKDLIRPLVDDSWTRNKFDYFDHLTSRGETSEQIIDIGLKRCISYTIDNDSIDMKQIDDKYISLYYREIIQSLAHDSLTIENELIKNALSMNVLDGKTSYSASANHRYSAGRRYSKTKDWNIFKQIRLNFQSNKKKSTDHHLQIHSIHEIDQSKISKSTSRPSRRRRQQKQQRKRVQPLLQNSFDSDLSFDENDDDRRDSNGRKRVAVIDCLLESSSPEETSIDNGHQFIAKSNDVTAFNNRKGLREELEEFDHVLTEPIVQLIKNSSETLALTFSEFCHLRNVITRAELETLLFNDKLYNDVAQSKLCFTCRKVYFNFLTFTFGVHCTVCKQKVCRNCLTQIALPKMKFTDMPMQAVTPLTLNKPVPPEVQTPLTPMMNDVLNDADYDSNDSRRCSTPGNRFNSTEINQWPTELINICTDCFFLLQHIRKKARQRHIPSTATAAFLHRSHLSSSSSASSIAALLVQHPAKSLLVKSISNHSALNQTRSFQDLSSFANVDPHSKAVERSRLSRNHLFLNLKPIYDVKQPETHPEE